VTESQAAIPVWVVTGPLGSGKTTVIASLLAGKPAAENWVVLLNEFTDAGIDTLTVAAAARGAFDVRLVPGGCLCCAGEADFRRNLAQLISEVKPARILVEPSGIGHPGGIVDELLAHQQTGALRLEAVVGLLAPDDLARVPSDETVRAAVEIADVLLLSKSDLAHESTRQQFAQIVAESFPPKRAAAGIERGQLDEQLLSVLATSDAVLARRRSEQLGARPALHAHQHAEAEPQDELVTTTIKVADGERRHYQVLGREGARWSFPRSVAFGEARLLSTLLSAHKLLESVERLKAVLRVGDDDWILLQLVDGRVHLQPTAWRRDNRIEVQCRLAHPLDAAAWDDLWRHCRTGSR
jgi:G3E family GTPase